MECNIKYTKVIKDYIREYKRTLSWRQILLIFYLIINSYFYYKDESYGKLSFLPAVPIFFAIISGVFHQVSLHTMMYIVPYTDKMREKYIQMMLNIKIAVPFVFAVIYDLVLLSININENIVKAIILQLVSVLLISYLSGTLNDGNVAPDTLKTAFGGLSYFIAAICVLCILFGMSMILICSSEISDVKFVVIFISILLIMGSIAMCVAKRWDKIRKNLANYEMARKVEVQNRRW